MSVKVIRVVSRAPDGSIRTKEYQDTEELCRLFEQIGIDDCSTDLSLRGFPLFRGLIGPIAETKSVALYESPDVFEFMTKEWSQKKTRRRRRRTAEEIALEASQAKAASAPAGQTSHPVIPSSNINWGSADTNTLSNS
jgi:hypothetical protein